jgi:hypothetical protein
MPNKHESSRDVRRLFVAILLEVEKKYYIHIDLFGGEKCNCGDDCGVTTKSRLLSFAQLKMVVHPQEVSLRGR